MEEGRGGVASVDMAPVETTGPKRRRGEEKGSYRGEKGTREGVDEGKVGGMEGSFCQAAVAAAPGEGGGGDCSPRARNGRPTAGEVNGGVGALAVRGDVEGRTGGAVAAVGCTRTSGAVEGGDGGMEGGGKVEEAGGRGDGEDEEEEGEEEGEGGVVGMGLPGEEGEGA
eukprot:evm.model.NODE_16004_length_14985_cov_28.142208.6